jgi:hypothetical protein
MAQAAALGQGQGGGLASPPGAAPSTPPAQPTPEPQHAQAMPPTQMAAPAPAPHSNGRGLAAPKGDSYADTKRSTDTTKEEWNHMFDLMKSKDIQGFNWGGYAFERDEKMPSGYRAIFDRGVANNKPEGVS